jgi:hypothetical protein
MKLLLGSNLCFGCCCLLLLRVLRLCRRLLFLDRVEVEDDAVTLDKGFGTAMLKMG